MSDRPTTSQEIYDDLVAKNDPVCWGCTHAMHTKNFLGETSFALCLISKIDSQVYGCTHFSGSIEVLKFV